VAFRWRIRHKLMLGLAVVVGVIVLLLAGTLYGLESFRATVRSIESKQAELNKAELFKGAVNDLRSSSAPQGDLSKFRERIHKARSALDDYRVQLDDTLEHRRDPDHGFEETELVKALGGKLNDLDGAAQAYFQQESMVFPCMGADQPLAGDRQAIRDTTEALAATAADLREAIYKDLYRRSQDARVTFRNTLWIVLTTGVAGVLLMGGLLSFFYRWMFDPIRDLEAGAGRLAQGDFEHHIEVHSGDELEDLAGAFNNMTGRLREMYGGLARQVNERSRQLVRSERLASVGFLAAGVAHEINNPLASIAFCSEALEHRLADLLARKPDNAEVITKYLKMIQQEAFRCKAITQRLLEFSRGGERRREPADLAEVIQAVLDMVQHLQNCKGKHIVFDSSGPLVAAVNAQEIKSVVLNLVVNALDSMDDGGTLTITLAERDQMADMTFADTGCGMSPEILENIFEPFFTRSRTGKGTGLGLSISHRVISQHGGEIEAASPGLNQGSTFTVRLPLKPAEPVKEELLGHAAA
jgi:signal transduction histidine kinase